MGPGVTVIVGGCPAVRVGVAGAGLGVAVAPGRTGVGVVRGRLGVGVTCLVGTGVPRVGNGVVTVAVVVNEGSGVSVATGVDVGGKKNCVGVGARVPMGATSVGSDPTNGRVVGVAAKVATGLGLTPL